MKHPYKGRNSLNKYACPVDSSDHENMKYLSSMVSWLDAWFSLSSIQPHKQGFLTKDTFLILRHTLKVLKEIAKYLLEELKFDFVLFGKFQTDNLENRFGQYRQMSGGNRLVSVQEIKESERKLKIKSLLKLHSSHHTISVKDYLAEFSESPETVPLTVIDQQFVEEFPHDLVKFDETQLPVLLYVAGYAAKKITSRLSCVGCKQLLVDEGGECLQVDIGKNVLAYFEELNRGGLTYPSSNLLNVYQSAHGVFTICISENYEKKFILLKNQKAVLKKIIFHYWNYFDILLLSTDCNLCLENTSVNLLKCVSILLNIMLNNYSKAKNDNIKYSAVTANRVAKF